MSRVRLHYIGTHILARRASSWTQDWTQEMFSKVKTVKTQSTKNDATHKHTDSTRTLIMNSCVAFDQSGRSILEFLWPLGP